MAYLRSLHLYDPQAERHCVRGRRQTSIKYPDSGEDRASEDALSNREKATRHFSYPVPQSEQAYHAQYTTVTDVSTFAATALPPASTLTKSDPAAALGYPMFSTQKTFIVPLTSSAQPSVPVVVDPNPSPIDQSQVPGLMVSYMMPAQSYVS